eukprot:CAMPEP_0169321566 /NCGR_PEP_ID=MMETSP1017-20121227/8957_1 /TAXON_ID=342587 /ORGANISM="Karlodinium micrum, Strain CCMP2283" /LENGTH=453 /DNA_ID=CAMNT_0009416055 /DNA_START=46 /DNA_END=1405 /DNA_ORIENTATION=-
MSPAPLVLLAGSPWQMSTCDAAAGCITSFPNFTEDSAFDGPLVTRDGVDIEIAVVEDRRDYAVEVSQSSVSPSQGSMHLNTHAPVDLGNPSLDRARSEETAIVVGLKQDCNKVGSSNDVSSMLEINIENDDRVDVVDRSESAIEFHGQDSSTWGNSLVHEEVSEPRYIKNVVSAPAHIIAKVRGRAAAEAKEVWARIAEAQSKNLQKLANRWAMACHIPGDAQSQVCILATVGASDGCTLTTSHPQDTSAVGESESSSAREGRGCIHRAVRESVQTPGPGHYEIAPARVDSSTLQPWARRGTLLREKNLARFDLDRDAGLLGPGYYDAKQIARCVGGVFNQAKRRNVYSRNFVDSSYVARESTQFDVIEACNQALATKFPSTPVPRLDHCTNDANLDYKSATWRLGGNLIISAPGGLATLPLNRVAGGMKDLHGAENEQHVWQQVGTYDVDSV